MAVIDADMDVRRTVLPHGSRKNQVYAVFRLQGICFEIRSYEAQIRAPLLCPGGMSSHSVRIKHLSMSWNKKVLVHVSKVGVVLYLVERSNVLEGVCIMIHLSHVVILEHRPKHVFRDVAKGILMLCEDVAWITIFVDIDLQMFAV